MRKIWAPLETGALTRLLIIALDTATFQMTCASNRLFLLVQLSEYCHPLMELS